MRKHGRDWGKESVPYLGRSVEMETWKQKSAEVVVVDGVTPIRGG